MSGRGADDKQGGLFDRVDKLVPARPPRRGRPRRALIGGPVPVLDPDEPAPANDLDRRARVWMGANPEIFAEFERLALEAAARRRAYSVWMIANVVRWNRTFSAGAPTPGGDGFKIPNSAMAYVARRLIRRNPSLAGLLQTRRIRGEA